jgi:hypothetical protein
MSRHTLSLILAAAPCLLSVHARAQQAPVVVLTDTVEYCDQLQHRLLDHPGWTTDVKRLFAEGRQMCDHGDIRLGINRLRQALRILNHHIPAP